MALYLRFAYYNNYILTAKAKGIDQCIARQRRFYGSNDWQSQGWIRGIVDGRRHNAMIQAANSGNGRVSTCRAQSMADGALYACDSKPSCIWVKNVMNRFGFHLIVQLRAGAVGKNDINVTRL